MVTRVSLACRQDAPPPETEVVTPACALSVAENPLLVDHQGTVLVRCPACAALGPAWRWRLQQSPHYQTWTVPTYRCRGCGHVFGLKA